MFFSPAPQQFFCDFSEENEGRHDVDEKGEEFLYFFVFFAFALGYKMDGMTSICFLSVNVLIGFLAG